MLFLVTQKHEPGDCPGRNPAEFKHMVEKFSEANVQRARMKFVAGYIDHACMLQTSDKPHAMTFLFDTDSPNGIADFFTPFKVEIRRVVAWEKVTE